MHFQQLKRICTLKSEDTNESSSSQFDTVANHNMTNNSSYGHPPITFQSSASKSSLFVKGLPQKTSDTDMYCLFLPRSIQAAFQGKVALPQPPTAMPKRLLLLSLATSICSYFEDFSQSTACIATRLGGNIFTLLNKL